MVGRPVDGFDAYQSAAAEAEHREMAVGRVAADDRLVMTRGDPRNLQLQIALVAPEPGHLFINFRPASETGGDTPRLIDGVLYGVEPEATGGEGRREIGAIADRRDVRIVGGEVSVDHNTIIDGEPGCV